jgi:hypothetical protein
MSLYDAAVERLERGHDLRYLSTVVVERNTVGYILRDHSPKLVLTVPENRLP